VVRRLPDPYPIHPVYIKKNSKICTTNARFLEILSSTFQKTPQLCCGDEWPPLSPAFGGEGRVRECVVFFFRALPINA